MSAWEERGDEIWVRAHRVKTWLTVGLFVVMGGGSIVAAAAEPRYWVAWAGVLLFGVGGAFTTWRYWRRGLLAGKGIVRLSRDGLEDRQTGLAATWDNVTRIEFWQFSTRGVVQRFLGLEVVDPERVRISRAHRFGASLNHLLPQTRGRPAFNIHLNLLATTEEELASLLARYFDGPIDGVGVFATPPVRPPRLQRFGRWVKEWVVTLAIAVVGAGAVIWVLERL